MFTLKKPLLLIVLLGMISLSLCEQERNADEEEGSEIKRGIFSKLAGKKLKNLLISGLKNVGKEVGMDVVRTGIDIAGCKIKGEC
uniref:Esculentin-1B n=4 Tax=Pelophylax TaxID=121164 RepID=ES1B_PELLE|nr:RecName: Full=Esculentin-1B; Flags: Precursor [Pelophylax lessonae]AYN64369.1 esculentin-1A precursor [Pelophylax lessonae]CAA54844.1 esculentin 1b precursor [Pelophylax lessonae]